jgi:hypothetical protein
MLACSILYLKSHGIGRALTFDGISTLIVILNEDSHE